LTAVGASLATLAAGALVLPHSFSLTALSDLVQAFLLASGTAAFIPLALRSRGRRRLFWSLMALGVGFWLSYQLLWTYYEVVMRREVPDIFTGDVVLFLHIVPLMAALALRPHVPPDEYATRLGRLDFLLLLVWWLYLYVLIVFPWQYAMPDPMAYIRDLNTLYLAEQFALLAALAIFWIRTRGRWQSFYAHLFGVGLTYALSSWLANWAIERNSYYSGSLYDVPLAASMAWLTWIALRMRGDEAQSETQQATTAYGVWVARLSMIAAFSLPLFAAWCLADPRIPPQIRKFRLIVTLAAALLMGVMVFFRQHLLDRELMNLLDHSRESVQSLKRLQQQVLQSEKLASVGQLVGGAAHELNNPITAMLGYSDLLASTPLTPAQQPLATRIGQCVRRTRLLVASLLSFARQTPAAKTLVDLNTLARTAVKLTQSQWEPLQIEVRTQFDPGMRRVMGDSNQLLQVCLQLVGNCLHALGERGGKRLSLSTSSQSGISVLQIATEAAPPADGLSGLLASFDSENGLALSACQGIVQEHRGAVSYEMHDDGAIRLRMELPATEIAAGAAKPDQATVPVMWQPRPSV
jgi:signal transduction histidine kinase